MKLAKSLTALVAVAALGACTTTKDWAATGGSRADGVVRLSYEVGQLERAQLSETQAVDIATRRCLSWGYGGAEAFGGATRQCNQYGGLGGCAQWLITKEFQCTGTGAANTAAKTAVIAPASPLALISRPQAASQQLSAPSPEPEPAPMPATQVQPPIAAGGGYEAALKFAAQRDCSAGGVSLVSGNVYRASCPRTGRSLIIQCQGPTCKEIN